MKTSVNSHRRIFALSLLVALAAVCMPLAATATEPAQDENLAYAIGVQTYISGFPLMDLYRTLWETSFDPKRGHDRTPGIATLGPSCTPSSQLGLYYDLPTKSKLRHRSLSQKDVVRTGSWSVRDAGGNRTHFELLCRQPPGHLAPASSQCPCQESNLIFELRGLACESGTLQGQIDQHPAEESKKRPADSKSAMPTITLAGRHQSVSIPTWT